MIFYLSIMLSCPPKLSFSHPQSSSPVSQNMYLIQQQKPEMESTMVTSIELSLSWYMHQKSAPLPSMTLLEKTGQVNEAASGKHR